MSKKYSQEWKDKIALTLIGRRNLSGTFKKGNIPFNKGLKGVTGIHPNSRATQFKKGQISHNYKGGFRISNNWGLERDIGLRRLTGSIKYVGNARYVYEQYHKVKIPKGYVIIHKDGDKYNDSIENLEMISLGENLKRNRKLKNLKCIICGKEYKSNAPDSKTCSRECYKENCKIKNKIWQMRNRDKMNSYKRKWKQRQKIKMSGGI